MGACQSSLKKSMNVQRKRLERIVVAYEAVNVYHQETPVLSVVVEGRER